MHGDIAAALLEFLAGLPTTDEILALRPSKALQARIDLLLMKSKESALTDEEEREWQRYEYLEHLVRLAKTGAHARFAVV